MTEELVFSLVGSLSSMDVVGHALNGRQVLTFQVRGHDAGQHTKTMEVSEARDLHHALTNWLALRRGHD